MPMSRACSCMDNGALVCVMFCGVVNEISGVRVLKKDTFTTLHPALQRHLLRRAYKELRCGSAEDLEQSHIEAMLTLVEGPAGKEMTLPGGVRLEVEHRQEHGRL